MPLLGSGPAGGFGAGVLDHSRQHLSVCDTMEITGVKCLHVFRMTKQRRPQAESSLIHICGRMQINMSNLSNKHAKNKEN